MPVGKPSTQDIRAEGLALPFVEQTAAAVRKGQHAPDGKAPRSGIQAVGRTPASEKIHMLPSRERSRSKRCENERPRHAHPPAATPLAPDLPQADGSVPENHGLQSRFCAATDAPRSAAETGGPDAT